MGFSAYLQSVIADYAKQRDRYTLTDLQVEYWEEKARSPDDREQQTKQVERLEVLAGLRKYVQKGHVVLVGKPGSGKSTALGRLRWELAEAALVDETQPIPVLVALRGDRSILDAICAEFRRAGVRVKPEQVDECLLEGRLFLLLDGLNEIPSLEREQEVRLFREDNPHTPMIFTSRELGTGLGLEQRLEMCGLTEPQMRLFVQKYLPDYAEVLLRQLQDRLRELAETPLLLKLLCEVFDPVTQQIPQSKGELFRAVDKKFNTWKTNEGVRTEEKFWQWNSELLQCLAFQMLQADGTPTGKWLHIERDRAEHLLEAFLKDRVTAPGEKAKDWVQDLLDHHLLQPAATANQIEFHHQLFQEYYAAEYLRRQLPSLSEAQLKRDYLNLLKWTEPLAVMLSLLADEKQALQLVKGALAIDWRLGARLAGEVKPRFQAQTVSQVASLDVQPWLKVELLEQTGSEQAIAGLLTALHDVKSDVRRSAADALGQIGSEQAIPGSLTALHDADWVRRSVAVDLCQIISDRAIPILLTALQDTNWNVRWSAVKALGNFTDDRAPHILPHILPLLPTESGKEALQALNAVQANCQFYNYEIFQLPPEPAPPTATDLHVKIDTIDQRTKLMAEQPSISISTISGGIQNFTPNQGTQTSTNIGTQNNYFGADDDFQKQIADLNQFIAEVEAKHPQVQTETTAIEIVDAEIVAVQTQDASRWQTLRQQMLLLKRQLLNPERHLQAAKATAVEVVKTAYEKSLIAKAILTYLDKLSETPDQGA
ncbi:MAG: NACHT domain-containing protein [Cyanobacteria bacterium CRU_2_1]|nr:NACHT domain-containing protein [Cyanobacteria bacterium CRU_2_1]